VAQALHLRPELERARPPREEQRRADAVQRGSVLHSELGRWKHAAREGREHPAESAGTDGLRDLRKRLAPEPDGPRKRRVESTLGGGDGERAWWGADAGR